MTEMANGIEPSQGTPSSQPVQSQPTSQVQNNSSPSDERTFKQTEVNDIVKRVKHEAAESFKRMQSEQPQYLHQKMGDSNEQYQRPNTQNVNNAYSDETNIRRMAAEEAQRMRDEWIQATQAEAHKESAKRTVDEFWNKVSTGKEKYQDFEQVAGDIEYARFPNVVQLLAHHIDNADSVLYELGKDRIKMANLEALAERSPRDAIVQAKRLAQSIKDNEATQNIKIPNAPLSQMRPSNTGIDNGAMSVKDLRAKYRM